MRRLRTILEDTGPLLKELVAKGIYVALNLEVGEEDFDSLEEDDHRFLPEKLYFLSIMEELSKDMTRPHINIEHNVKLNKKGQK